MKLRRMRKEDLDWVVAVASGLKEAPHWAPGAYLAALELSSMPRRIALVAELPESGAIVGFAVASVLPPQGELESIAVAAAEQRQGIGRNLISALLEELKAEGVREVFLEVRASNQRAIGFYRSLGWTEAGRRPRYYADPEEDAVLMNLGIEPVERSAG
jgi:ribosomal-protein-alanine N-acetyltransferase